MASLLKSKSTSMYTFYMGMNKCEQGCTCGRHAGPWASKPRNRELGMQYNVKPTKICRVCEQEKPRSEFYERKGLATTAGRAVLRGECKECTLADRKAFHSDQPEEKRRNNLLKSYGLTFKQYNEMLERQGGGCAICGTTSNKNLVSWSLSVDHDHSSGRVRGILCNSCNRAIGLLGDDLDRLKRAVEYLEGKVI
jgi:protein-arginine kinase activator protein McsA